MGNLFRRFKAGKRVWLTFLYTNLKKKWYRVEFVRLKANKKCTPDVFTGLNALEEMSLKHLLVIMSEIQYI